MRFVRYYNYIQSSPRDINNDPPEQTERVDQEVLGVHEFVRERVEKEKGLPSAYIRLRGGFNMHKRIRCDGYSKPREVSKVVV